MMLLNFEDHYTYLLKIAGFLFHYIAPHPSAYYDVHGKLLFVVEYRVL